MKISYTARKTFDSRDGEAWTEFISWSRLSQLKEIVGMDYSLSELAFIPDFNTIDYWNNIFITENNYETYSFKNLEYLLQQISVDSEFNLLAVCLEPNEPCIEFKIDNFDFIGYELLDQSNDTSALTNCGGFDETFSNEEINSVGLIESFDKAFEIKKKLIENNPNEYHAYTNVWGIWRHTTIGRV